jgi:putative methionine-R-sulfoxide reductase with GAF domain
VSSSLLAHGEQEFHLMSLPPKAKSPVVEPNPNGEAPFGVLEVDARSEGDFSEQDITFLRGAANVLGMAIERERSSASRFC